METYANLQKAAEQLNVDAWIELCEKASEQPADLAGIPMPSLPSAELQAGFVGSSGRHAMFEASKFYKYALASNQAFRNRPVGSLLDFGCGWGRCTRLFLRDVPESGLYGADPNETAIQVCRQHVPYGCFVNTDRRPPLPFRDNLFDLVASYSVFSHLSEINAANWIYELSRVIRPGGILVATTHAQWLLDTVEQMQQGQKSVETQWHRNLVRSWPDVKAARAKYEAGGFLFSEAGEYREGYGDALVPEQYVRQVWGRIMEPMEYVIDRSRMPQAAFVLQKR